MKVKYSIIAAVSFIVVFCFNCLVFALPAGSPPVVDSNLEQAIWQYEHENFEEACALLKDLREKYPQSSLVAYYMGITYKQMQDYRKAKPHLLAAVTLKPKIKNALTELIDLLYKKGDIEEAKQWIKVAEIEDINPDQTAFFKGLVLLKEGEDMDGAVESLERAKELNESIAETADYYIGLAYVKNEQLKDAKNVFREIVAQSANPSLSAFADQYLDAISKREEVMRPFHFNVGGAVQYDDNVLLQPDAYDVAVDIGNKADWRQVYTANADYVLRPSKYFDTKLGYSLYWAKQCDLGFYDTVYHKFLIEPTFYPFNLSMGCPITFDIISVNDKHYLTTIGVGTVNNAKIGKNQMVQAAFIYRNKDYIWTPSTPDEDRDASEYLWRLGWFYFFANKKGFAHLRYTLNYDDTKGNNWRHRGQRFTFSTVVPLWKKIKTGATLEYNLQNFLKIHSVYGKYRRDDVFTIAAFLTYEIIKNIELQLNYIFVDNRSNISVYEYKRNVYSAGVKYKF